MHMLVRGYKLISKGAEAYIYYCKYGEFDAIRKIRIKKRYRIDKLDEALRKHRTKREAKLLHLSKRIGVPTPVVFDVDIKSYSIFMEYIPGELLRNFAEANEKKVVIELFKKLGEHVGLLHENNIVHGDLTTSNVIVTADKKLILIDFGLGEITTEYEPKGIELRVFYTSLTSAHHRSFNDFMMAFIRGYKKTYSEADRVLRIFENIKMRGRYIADRRLKKLYVSQY